MDSAQGFFFFPEQQIFFQIFWQFTIKLVPEKKPRKHQRVINHWNLLQVTEDWIKKKDVQNFLALSYWSEVTVMKFKYWNTISKIHI